MDKPTDDPVILMARRVRDEMDEKPKEKTGDEFFFAKAKEARDVLYGLPRPNPGGLDTYLTFGPAGWVRVKKR